MTIPMAGARYVGLANATRFVQYADVVALDIIPEKVSLRHQKEYPNKD